MCGRYHIKSEDLEKLMLLLGSMGIPFANNADDVWPVRMLETDVHPSEDACVLTASGGGIAFARQKWGFPDVHGGLLINARAETALHKPRFSDSVSRHRIVVPASWFYEWNKSKDKYTFACKDEHLLYLAGCYSTFNGQESFVILTTEANSSVGAVHPRMPLVLERDELMPWLTNGSAATRLLGKRPGPLQIISGQNSIF
jgi:putative SOS response-associated peptidase YedK